MAKNQNIFETVVRLNTQEAQNELQKMKKNLEDLKKKKSDLLSTKTYDPKDLRSLNKEINSATAQIRAYNGNIKSTIDTLNDLDHASLGEIQASIRALRKEMKNITDASEYEQLDALIQKASKRILELKSSAKQTAEQMERMLDADRNLSKVMANLNTATLDELRRAATTAQEKLSNIAPDTMAFRQAADNLEKIKSRIDAVKSSQSSANKTIDDYEREIAAATRAAADLTRENRLIEATLKNINGSNLRDLEYSLKLVKEQLRGMSTTDDSFDALTDKAKALKIQIDKVKASMGDGQAQKSFFTRAWNWLNVNWGAMAQLWVSLTGITQTVRQCTGAFASMEDVMANTRKYTGQTDEQVRELNEDLKKMDTRSSREQLNALAGAAGRLGITSKNDIEEFVDAADKINVALGDDLGDEAVDQIGKLAMTFGEDQKMGLRGAMLATGSAVNELAQSCSANAGYLVDFTSRVAGVGKQFGLTQEQIMGFGAVMDENMLRNEMSATAFNQLLTKMTTDTKTFADIAGVEVGKFTKMLKEDANGAVITLLESLKSKGDFNTVAKMFDDMKLNGTEAVSVLSTLADKIDDVKIRQATATQAYLDGTSVLKEFDVQNNTVQAEIDKNKKTFEELTITLGQRLLPIAKYGISTASMAVRALNAITTFAMNNWKVLLSLTTGIIAYTVAVKAQTLANLKNKVVDIAKLAIAKAKVAMLAVLRTATTAYTICVELLTGKITLASAAQQFLNKVILANPYLAAAAAVTGLTATIIAFATKNNDAARSQNALTKANNEASASCRGEIEELSALIEVAKDKTKSDAARQEAIKKLQEKYPEYLRNLTLENIYSTQTARSMADLTNQILAQAQARVYLAKVEEMERKKQDVDNEYLKSFWGQLRHGFASQFESFANNVAHYAEKLWNAAGGFFKNGPDGFTLSGLTKGWNEDTYIQRNGYATNPNRVYLYNWRAERQKYDKEQQMYLAEYRKKEQQIAEINARLNNNSVGTALPTGNSYATTTDSIVQKQAEKQASIASKRRDAEQRKNEALMRKNQKEAIASQKAITDAELVENYRKYSQGEIDLRKYRSEEQRINQEGLDEQIKIYGKESNEAQELLRQKTEMEANYNETVTKMDEEEIQRRHASIAVDIQQSYNEKGTIMYQNEEAVNEMLYQNDIDSLLERQKLYKKGTEEWLDLQAEIEEKEDNHRLENAQHYNELLAQYRERMGLQDLDRQKAITMNGLAWLENYELKSIKEIDGTKEEEIEQHNQKVLEITKKYAKIRKEISLQFELSQSEENLSSSAFNQFQGHSSDAFQTARNNAQASWNNENPTGGGLMEYVSSDVSIYSKTLANIKDMEKEGVISHQEAMDAMSKATADMTNGMAAKFQAAYDAISGIMSGMSGYYSAQSDYEVAVSEKKYDKLIEQAGNNTAKAQKLEEKKQKETNKIKTKYEKKQAMLDIANIIMTTSIAAMNAYSSALQIPVVGLTLAPIAMAAALAAGAIQIATVKKQAQAKEAAYYEGGFTGGTNYRREAGVVHEGEFVANHQAVNNPSLQPVLQLIDLAQKNNTIGSLTSSDVSKTIGISPAATLVSAPTVTVHSDNKEMAGAIQRNTDTIERLGALLEDGIHADVVIDGPNGFDRQYKMFKKLQERK